MEKQRLLTTQRSLTFLATLVPPARTPGSHRYYFLEGDLGGRRSRTERAQQQTTEKRSVPIVAGGSDNYARPLICNI